MHLIFIQGQGQSAGSGSGGEKKDDKDKKKKYEPPIPTRVGKKKRKAKGPDAATKLPQGKFGSLYLFPETVEFIFSFYNGYRAHHDIVKKVLW